MLDEDTRPVDISFGDTYVFHQLYHRDDGLIAYSSAGVEEIEPSVFRAMSRPETHESAWAMLTEVCKPPRDAADGDE
eukprot:4829518-Prorocentrum_lima.AAC.1